ncbi:MAG: heat shock protein transcriptional repressor HspR [Beutenbergiaceae bacterium]
MARYDAPTFLISEAAARAGMHAQTLRTYDRLGLVVPRRAAGRGRRYSLRDIDKLSEIQRLSQQEGINLAGVRRIFALVEENEALRSRVQQLRGVADSGHRVFTASPAGDIVAGPRGARPRGTRSSAAVVVWRSRG